MDRMSLMKIGQNIVVLWNRFSQTSQRLRNSWLRGAERIWPPSAARRSVAVPNGEGVASGSATRVLKKSCNIHQKFKNLRVLRQSPFARKALCATGRAGSLACAAAAVYPAIHKSRPAAAQHIKFPPCILLFSYMVAIVKVLFCYL